MSNLAWAKIKRRKKKAANISWSVHLILLHPNPPIGLISKLGRNSCERKALNLAQLLGKMFNSKGKGKNALQKIEGIGELRFNGHQFVPRLRREKVFSNVIFQIRFGICGCRTQPLVIGTRKWWATPVAMLFLNRFGSEFGSGGGRPFSQAYLAAISNSNHRHRRSSRSFTFGRARLIPFSWWETSL